MTPLKGYRADRAGHDLGMHSPPFQLWKELSYFPPADQRFAAYDRQVQRPIQVNQRKDSLDKLFSLEFADFG
jgi:hypothetical protein